MFIGTLPGLGSFPLTRRLSGEVDFGKKRLYG